LFRILSNGYIGLFWFQGALDKDALYQGSHTSIASIEPLLFNIRKSLTGLSIPTMSLHLRTIITAYADDVTVFVNENNDIKEYLMCMKRALSAKVNWIRIKAFW